MGVIMNNYIFKTNATMKEHNQKNWWIDSRVIPEIHIKSDNIVNALKEYQNIVTNDYYITISDNALKNKRGMYRDTVNGSKQVGFVLTASTDFQKDNYSYSKQYIDLWVEVLTLVDTIF